MSDEVEQLGNDGKFSTWVVDPNPLNSDNIIPEDLFVWVNFRALPKSRSAIETDGTYESEFFSSKGVQFITTTEQNEKGYATTNYTNIGGNTGEKEAFGIQSITMEYGNMLVPQAKITFVDVRGAGLFNGYEYEDERGMKYNSSEFSTFFRLPYPLFELSVKGFYGRPVTYCLHLKQWNASFDAENGNFIIEAEFIGYTFAFLSDILMQYVKAVTSSEIGESAIDKAGVIPLSDFLSSLGQLTRISEEFKDNSTDFKELVVVNSILFQLDKLLRAIGKPVDMTLTSIYGNTLPYPQIKVNVDQVFVRDVGVISEQEGSVHDTIVEDIEKFVKEYNVDLIKKYQGTYSYMSKYKISNFDIQTPNLSRELNQNTVTYINNEIQKDNISSASSKISLDTLRTRFSLPLSSNKKFYIINYHNFRQEISDLKEQVGNKKNDIEKIINRKLNEKLTADLGFDLSIQTVFEILLGNVEAYIEVVYNIAVEADNVNLQPQRISDLNNVRTDINTGDARIYPFPAAYDSTTGKEVWLGDIVGENNPAFPELRFVKEVMNAMVASSGKKTKKRIQNNDSNSLNEANDGWIPVNPLDYNNNALANIDKLSFNNNIIPVEFAQAIVSRAMVSYNNSLYRESRYINFAQMEAAYTASQIKNNIYKQLIKTFDTKDFVSQVINKSGFSNNLELNKINGFDFATQSGVLISGYNTNDNKIISDIIHQQSRSWSKELVETINGFKSNIIDTLILTKEKYCHRDLNTNASYVNGDVTDILWNDTIQKNIKKFYKSQTSYDLEKNQPTSRPVLSVLNDLTVIDGQINQTVDYTKDTDKDIKFTNNSRSFIAKNRIKIGDDASCIFDTEYYKQSDLLFQAYLYLITLPMDNISDFTSLFDLAGVYKISEVQMAWVSAQFWRAYEIQQGNDPFDTILQSESLKNTLDTRFPLFADEFIKLKELTKSYLPDLNIFDGGFIIQMIDYFGYWVIDEFSNTISSSKPTIMNAINYIAEWEDFYGYSNYGLTNTDTLVAYGLSKEDFNSKIANGIDGAIDIYRESYLPIIGILPLDMQSMALDIAIGQYDPLGFILATANRMGIVGTPDFTEVRDRWNGEGIYTPAQAQNLIPYPLEYLTTTSAQEYSTFSLDIETLFNNDKERFLDELTKTRLMVYSGMPLDIKPQKFPEWSVRVVSMTQFCKDYSLSVLQENKYYYGLNTSFVYEGQKLADDLNYAVDFVDAESWYSELRSKTSKYLINITPPLGNLSGYGVEYDVNQYCKLSSNGINKNDSIYDAYKKSYDNVITRFRKIVDFVVVNPRKVIKDANTVLLSSSQLNQYLINWHETFQKNVRIENKSSVTVNNKTDGQEYYIQDKDIKIATYNHFKNLYDKWIGGSKSEQIHNSCTCNGILRTSKLIDRFHFIDRTWSHIGDEAVINPKALLILSKDTGIDLYSLLGRLLTANSFQLHVLPSWVNYKNLEDVKQMWKPQTNLNNISQGAAYVCMYMGGTSKVLDLGKKSLYINDGFDLRDIDKNNIPSGFTNRRVPKNIDELEDSEKFKYNMVVFRVGYADQNQSIFKNISNLSQKEHRLTAESMAAEADALDNRGGTKRFYKGVNLYNVFALRSYQCTISCMGNMQIHPLTYFQLDNIPFFHGAYIITKVSHSIEPHYIETTFTGRRVPRYVVPIVDSATSFIGIPLSDTLFKPHEKGTSIVRPLNNNIDGYYSNGSDEIRSSTVQYQYNGQSYGEGKYKMPTRAEYAAFESGNRVIFTGQYSNVKYTFYLENMTEVEFIKRMNDRFSIRFGYPDTKSGLCARWVRYALMDVGIAVKPYGYDAWKLFTSLDDSDLKYITDADYIRNTSTLGHGTWSNSTLASIIPDGSIVFGTYLTSKSKKLSESTILPFGTATKVKQLTHMLTLDKLEQAKNKNLLAVTHVTIFYAGQIHHQVDTVLAEPRGMKIIAYYPFKDKALNKIRNS